MLITYAEYRRQLSIADGKLNDFDLVAVTNPFLPPTATTTTGDAAAAAGAAADAALKRRWSKPNAFVQYHFAIGLLYAFGGQSAIRSAVSNLNTTKQSTAHEFAAICQRALESSYAAALTAYCKLPYYPLSGIPFMAKYEQS